MTKPLKPYMAYSANLGSFEGAILVLAHSVRDARVLAWESNTWLPAECESYIDLAARLIRKPWNVLPLADQEKLAAGIPHVIEEPLGYASCGFWGCGLTADDRCPECDGDPGSELVRRLKSFLEE